MVRLTEFVLRHRRWVLIGWLVIFVAGVGAASGISKRLSFEFSLPGQPGYETGKKIVQLYGNGGEQQPELAVLTAPAGAEAQLPATAASVFGAMQRQLPFDRVVDYATTGDRVFRTNDGRTTYALVFYPVPRGFADNPDTPIAAALHKLTPPGYTSAVTGYNALAVSKGGGSGPGVLTETIIGAFGALAVLAFVFASMLAFLPLAMAAVSILATFLILTGITEFTSVSFIVQYLVALIGLGVSIDYSLLIVNRWREERAHGRDNHEAVVVAMQTAGHAVLASGVTVAIGLFALVVLPVPFLRSIGFGGMLIPLVSVLVASTLLPALLGGIGPRVDWPRLRHEGTASRFWTGWARFVVRARWASAAVAVAILAALVVPFFGIKIGLAASASLAKSGPAYEALRTLERGGVPGGVLSPIEVLTTTSSAPSVVAKARQISGIAAAVQPSGPASNRAGKTAVVLIPDRETVDASSVAPVKRVQSAVHKLPGVVGISGVGALQVDYMKAVYGNFPLMLALIILLTFVLLARTFRSLLLPLKAVILNVISLAAAFGAVVLFWQQGHGSEAVFGIHATGAVTFWQPIMVFAFLFGLSMDYEVFILSRVREEYDATGSTRAAVVEGMGRTGRLVTSAALILFLAFLSLSTGPETDIKVFATALGAGILLDATVIRALLVPALVSLLGRWNWWLPAWLAKPLRVAPSPLQLDRAEPVPREPAPTPL